MFFQEKLAAKYREICARNPRFSLRSFAKRIGINSGVLSSILSGKRPVSRQLAEQISTKVFEEDEINDILRVFPERRRSRSRAPQRLQYRELNDDELKQILDWQHYALLSLVRTENFDPRPQAIADRLGIEEATAATALRRLLDLGLLAQSESGKLVRTSARYRTSDGLASRLLRHAHTRNLELAARALEEVPVELRDFSALTLPIDPAKLPVAVQMIRSFLEELSGFLESNRKLEVYKVSVQLFPLTRPNRRKIP